MNKITHSFIMTFTPSDAPVVVERVEHPDQAPVEIQHVCHEMGSQPFETVAALALAHAKRFREFQKKWDSEAN